MKQTLSQSVAGSKSPKALVKQFASIKSDLEMNKPFNPANPNLDTCPKIDSDGQEMTCMQV